MANIELDPKVAADLEEYYLKTAATVPPLVTETVLKLGEKVTLPALGTATTPSL
ncbi:MAG: hypothetical protein NTY06_00590 [Candidatus Gottesmanbacteria bacterium]|nr:hypothetical protein [Candidatus Gottesmanbacteria bacterium]